MASAAVKENMITSLASLFLSSCCFWILNSGISLILFLEGKKNDCNLKTCLNIEGVCLRLKL